MIDHDQIRENMAIAVTFSVSPELVVSPSAYNSDVGLALACFIVVVLLNCYNLKFGYNANN